MDKTVELQGQFLHIIVVAGKIIEVKNENEYNMYTIEDDTGKIKTIDYTKEQNLNTGSLVKIYGRCTNEKRFVNAFAVKVIDSSMMTLHTLDVKMAENYRLKEK